MNAMKRICRLFGHVMPKGYARGVPYAEVLSGTVDGCGVHHLNLYLSCPRCGDKFPIVNVHVPSNTCTTDEHVLAMRVLRGDRVPLFVYGTLKRGYGNNRLLKHAHFVGKDKAPGVIYGGGVPVVQPPMPRQLRARADTPWVHGEVFMVNSGTLKECDMLEGHPVHYTRTPVELASGRPAFIYYWLHDIGKRYGATPIESGEWHGGSFSTAVNREGKA